jgi:cyanate lyase
MIQKFVDRFMDERVHLAAVFSDEVPETYKDIVRIVVSILSDLDEERIHEINDGGYDGTLVYVIPEADYIPRDYWYVKVAYGSCRFCDTLQDIVAGGDWPEGVTQVDAYMTLALHIVQGLKKMGCE